MNDKLNENVSIIISENINDYDLDVLIKYIINVLVKEMELKEYVKEVKVDEAHQENPLIKGSSDEFGNLILYKKGLDTDFEKTLEKTDYLTEFETVLLRVLFYLKTAFHELEHFNQKKLLAEDLSDNSLETVIIRSSQSGSLNNIGYSVLYEHYPTERLAEVKAYRNIIKVLENLKKSMDVERLYTFFKQVAIIEEIDAYHRYGPKGSTTQYFELLGDGVIEKIEEKLKTCDLSASEKFLYGLEITEEEYTEQISELKFYYEKSQTYSGQKLS